MRATNQFAGARSSPGSEPARYRTEMFVPVMEGSADTGQTSSTSWQTTHQRLDERRKQWNDEVQYIIRMYSLHYKFSVH